MGAVQRGAPVFAREGFAGGNVIEVIFFDLRTDVVPYVKEEMRAVAQVVIQAAQLVVVVVDAGRVADVVVFTVFVAGGDIGLGIELEIVCRDRINGNTRIGEVIAGNR